MVAAWEREDGEPQRPVLRLRGDAWQGGGMVSVSGCLHLAAIMERVVGRIQAIAYRVGVGKSLGACCSACHVAHYMYIVMKIINEV